MGNGFVSLAQQEALSALDWQRATNAAQYAQALMDQRESYIDSHGLRRDVWMPAGNWREPQAFYRYAREVLAGNTLMVEFLRLYSQQFSGHSLWTMTTRCGEVLPPLTRAEIEEGLRSLTPNTWAIRTFQELRDQLPTYLQVGPPARFGEVGWLVNGAIVNHDTVAYWERLLVLYRAGFLARDSPRQLRPGSRVLEIGAGYGALAWYIQEAVPDVSYTVIDIPESLIYAAIYLDVLHPGATRFLANYEFPAVVDRGEQFDLAINTMSMSEMSEPQVRAYADGIARLIAPSGAFFEQNQDNTHLGMLNAQTIIAEYFGEREMLGGPSNHATHLIHGFANVWRLAGAGGNDSAVNRDGAGCDAGAGQRPGDAGPCH